MKHSMSAVRLAAFALLLGLAAPAVAQTYSYNVYVDTDANPATGCAVTSSSGSISGAEVLLQVTATGGTTPHITGATRSVCSGGTFGSPAAIPGGAALGLNTGGGGADVIEFAVDEQSLRNSHSAMVRLDVIASSATGSDALVTVDGAGGRAIVLALDAQPIPLLTWPALVLLAIAFVWVGQRRARRWRLFAMFLLVTSTALAAHFIVDGQTGDWTGIPALATDPANDATSGESAIDLRALYAAIEDGTVYFRLDVSDLQNNPPSANPASATTLEDNATTLTLTGADPEGAPITFSIVTPPAKGTLGAVTSTGSNSATVLYTPNPDANGSDSFTFVSNDGQSNSVPATATITITPVNDVPVFTAQNPPAVNEDAGAQTATVATGIRPGPATATDEASQALNFIISNDSNPGLFNGTPTISAAGVLSFTPAANASGTAVLTVALHDDGGTSNGGVDTSATQTVTVTVNAVNDPPVLTAGATLAYTENQAATVIDGSITVNDVDSANLAGATVQISANYQAGADLLAFANTATISGSFNATTGVLTLSGSDSLANYQAALRSVTYANSSDDPTTTPRTITWVGNDGSANSAPVTSTISVTAVNDAPVITTSATASYTEDAAPVVIDPALGLTDPDNANLAGATVAITGNFTSGQDVLALTSGGGVTGSYNAATGVLTLSGNATVAAYRAALRSVTYANTSQNPNTGTRTLSWIASDGTASSNVASNTVAVVSVDDAPVLTAGGTLAYTENQAATVIDASVTVSDVDTTTASSASVQISANLQVGADVLSFTNTATITGIYTATTGTLTLSGVDTLANYQAALRSVKYANSSDDPGVAPRTISWTLSDGTLSSAPVTSTITVAAVNDPPVVTAGGTLNYTENQAPTAIDPGVTVADPDNATLAGGSVMLSSNFVSGQDVLGFAAANGISGSFNATTGVLTLSGSATVANYQAALRSVTYSNTSENPSGLARTIVWSVSDGTAASTATSSTINVTPVNDPPVVTAGASVTYTEGNPPLVLDAGITVSDVDNSTLAGASVAISANYTAGQDVLAFVPANGISGTYNTGTGVLSLSGSASVANYQAALASVTYQNTSQNPSTPTRTISWTVNDGAANSAAATSTVAIISINSAPVFTKGADQTSLEDAGARTVSNWATAINDGDGGGQALTFQVTGNSNPALFSTAPAVSSTGTLTYTSAPNANGSATITLVLKDDGGTANGGLDTSAPQSFVINVTAVNDAPGFAKGADQSVLENAGAQTVSNWATAISAGPADESGQAVAFNITGNTNAALFSVAPSVSPSGTLSFTPATNAFGTATITLVLQDNGGTANGGIDTSAVQTFAITVNNVNQPPSFTKGADQTVLEDAGAQSVNGWATAISAGPGEGSQTVSFQVTGDSNAALFSVAPAVSATGVLTYTTAANANGAATITLVAKDNGGTANGGVDTSGPQSFVINVTAVNDAPSFTKGADQSVLENAGAQSVANWATALSTGPADEASQTLSFQIIGNTNATLFSAAPSVSPSGTLTYTPATNGFGSATISLVLHDNGGTANGGVDTSAVQTFTITVNNVNQPPSFTKGGDQTVLEDAGAQTVNPWATAISAGPGEGSQTISFQVTGDSNAALFSVAPAVSATGVLTYTPAANANGSATITLVAKDNGGTANGGVDTSGPQSFVINVTAVNDAPSFTKGGDQTVLEDAGAQTVTNWATAISTGPADEASQTVSFNITGNTNAALFSVAPAVSATGTLTYTPAPNANGSAAISLAAHDSGGTANGGIDTSATQTFVINVSAVNDAPSFVKGPDQSVQDNVGPQTVNPWATAISAGPANESGQTVVFSIVSNSNAAIFSAGPAISSTGVLTYTPAPVALGTQTATILIQLQDNGGTANGGIDTSAPQSFTISVTHTNVPPAVIASPKESFDTVGNTQLEFAASPALPVSIKVTGNLVSNFTDSDGPSAITAAGIVGCADVTAPFDCATANGGTIHLAANGEFVFTPKPGDTAATDTFQYTVTDGATPSAARTVTIHLLQRVWYVDNSGAAGTGGSQAPFNTLAAAQAAAVANDYIFVYGGLLTSANQSNGIVLLAGQRLYGQAYGLPVTATVNGVANPVLVPADTTKRPLIDHAGSTNDGINITNVAGVEVRGLSVSGGQHAINLTTTSAGVGQATISDNVIRQPGTDGIHVAAGSSATTTVAISNNSITGNVRGVSLQKTAGTLYVTDLSNNTILSATPGTGFDINGATFDATPGGAFSTVSGGTTAIGASGSAVGASGMLLANVLGDLSFTDLDIYNNAGTGLLVSSTGALNAPAATGFRLVVASGVGTIDSNGGPAINVNNASLNLPNLTFLRSTNSTTTGINLVNAFGGVGGNTLSAALGQVSAGSGGLGINISGGNGGISFGGTVFGNINNHSIVVANRTSDIVSFSGAIGETGTGISLSNNTGAQIIFSGTITASTGGNTAFNAIGGGTVSASDINSTLTTTTASALNVTATTIGSGLTFKSITAGTAASGPINAIVLNGTGTGGGLSVLGTGSAGSGGTIQKTTGNAIALTNTNNTSLSRMVVKNGSHDGIHGVGASNFSLVGSTISGQGSVIGDSGIHLIDSSGNLGLVNDAVTGSYDHNVVIDTSAGSSAAIATMNVSGGSYNGSVTGDGFLVQMNGTAAINTASIANATFASNAAYGLNIAQNDNSVVGNSSGTLPAGAATIDSCTFTNNGSLGAGFAQGGGTGNSNMYVRFINNTLTGSYSYALNVDAGATSSGGTQRVLINNNHIGTTGVANSGSTIGEGIVVTQQGLTTQSVTITNNVIRDLDNGAGGFDARGIDVQALGSSNSGQPTAIANYVITGNDVNQEFTGTSTFVQYAIYVGVDDQASPTTVHAEIHGNTVPNISPCDTQCAASTGMIEYEQVAAPSTGTLYNFNGSGSSISAEIVATNTGLAGKVASTNTGLTLVGTPVLVVP